MRQNSLRKTLKCCQINIFSVWRRLCPHNIVTLRPFCSVFLNIDCFCCWWRCEEIKMCITGEKMCAHEYKSVCTIKCIYFVFRWCNIYIFKLSICFFSLKTSVSFISYTSSTVRTITTLCVYIQFTLVPDDTTGVLDASAGCEATGSCNSIVEKLPDLCKFFTFVAEMLSPCWMQLVSVFVVHSTPALWNTIKDIVREHFWSLITGIYK